ncbi:PAS domain S-box-containing protein [Sphingomonas sp. PvP055]|uniref:sensor histidine kinase n=1 Tax=Sphingomonas sp. PvP055 TaxID=3156391 RepID=UPI003397C6AE
MTTPAATERFQKSYRLQDDVHVPFTRSTAMNWRSQYELFMPHGMCFLWQPELMSLHVVSDALIALAYFTIPFAILRFVQGRNDLEPRHQRMALLFAAFIAFCGLTHVVSIYVLWVPIYIIEGWLKAITAVVSVATAIGLTKLVPQALALPSAEAMRIEIRAHRETMLALDAARAALAVKVDRTEEALRDSEQKFGAVVEHMSEGLMIFDPHGAVTFHNPASARIHGIEHESDGLFHRDELPVQWRGWTREGELLPFEEWPLLRVLRGERVRNQYLHAERADTGRSFDAVYNGAPIYAADGTLLLGFITLRDVRDEIEAQQALARTNDLLRGFTDAIPGVIFAKDREGRMVFANDGTAALIGKAKNDFLGKTDAEFLDDPAQANAVMANDRRVMETGTTEQIEEQVSLPNGAAVTWLSTKAPLRDADGTVTGIIGLSVDISAQKASEAELGRLNAQLESQTEALTVANGRLSAALVQRDLLLQEVYHRVKNNMQMVDSFLVLQKAALTDPVAKNALTSLRKRVHALGLVHHQLMQSGNLTTFDIAPFLRELADNILDGSASHDVGISVHADTLDVGLDFAIPLALLVTELVTNALKHAFPGGQGHIDVQLSRNADGSFALVVSDTGIGYTNALGPSAGGLGTKIITALVRQLRATMTMHSEHGTRVAIHIAAIE